MLPLIYELVKLISTALGISKPLIAEHLANASLEEANQRYEKWQQILEIKGEDDRANSKFEFIRRLCLDSGHASGSVSPCESIPLSHMSALVEIAIENIQLKQQLAALTFKLQQ